MATASVERSNEIVKWFAIHLAAVSVFLILWFGTGAGFGWGLIVGLLVYGLGVYAMRHGMAHSSEVNSIEP